MTGSAGHGTAGMSGSGMAGSGTAGSGMTGAGGSAAGASGAGGATGGSGGRASGGSGMGGSSSGAMTLTSSVITEGGMFPEDNTCNGDDKSPDLTWTPGPNGTMSYAVLLLDTNNSLNHWVIWDIPASVTMLPAGLDTAAMPSMPAGAKQKAFQGDGYMGPCPPSGDHLYRFTVYALPVAMLSGAMTSEQTSALAMDVMNATPLAAASLSAHFLGGN